MSTLFSFKEFISSKGSLSKTVGGYEACVNVNGTYQSYPYSREDIESADPKAYLIVEELFVLMGRVQSGLPMVQAEHIAASLSYWENPLLLTSTTGLGYHVGKINGIMEKKEDVDEFELSVVINVMNSSAKGNFVERTSWGTVEVSGTELDKHFPGWRIRYSLLKSLNTEHKELVKAVFSKHEICYEQSIEGVSF